MRMQAGSDVTVEQWDQLKVEMLEALDKHFPTRERLPWNYFGSPNLMSKTIIAVFTHCGFNVELSMGLFMDEILLGVHTNKGSEAFYTIADVLAFLNKLIDQRLVLGGCSGIQ